MNILDCKCMIGTWSWGSGMLGSNMIFGQKFPKEQLKSVFDKCSTAGLKYWDTAEVYGGGNAERILGSFIENENDIFVSSKHMPSLIYKKGENEKAIIESLQRLNISSIDLYWLHRSVNIEKNMTELARCYHSGLIKNIGISNATAEQIEFADKILRKNDCRISAVQNHYSLLSMGREESVLEYCKNNNIMFFGYMLLEQGALSGHHDYNNGFERFSLRGLTFTKGKLKKLNSLIEYIRFLGSEYDTDSSQIPIAWGISKGVVPIIGINKPHHIDTLKVGLSVKLKIDEIEKIETLALESKIRCKGVWE